MILSESTFPLGTGGHWGHIHHVEAAAGASATIRGVILYEFAERVWLCVSAPVSAFGTVVPVRRNSTS